MVLTIKIKDMSDEMISNIAYLYFMISTIALMKWGIEILDNLQKKRENGKAKD